MPVNPLDALNALAPEEVQNNNMLDDERTMLFAINSGVFNRIFFSFSGEKRGPLVF